MKISFNFSQTRIHTILIKFQNTLGALGQILVSFRQHASFHDVCNTIEKFDGLSYIERLQQHDNADIYLLAIEISLIFHENYVRSIEKC